MKNLLFKILFLISSATQALAIHDNGARSNPRKGLFLNRTQKSERIFAGLPASPGQFPFVARIEEAGRPHCAGAIVSNYHILTAAHCMSICHNGELLLLDLSALQVIVGDVDAGAIDSFEKRFKISKSFMHPKYVTSTTGLIWDFAILELETRIEMPYFPPDNVGGAIDYVRWPKFDFQPINSDVKHYVAGWGLINQFPEKFPKILQYAEMKIIDNYLCTGRKTHPAQMCAINPDPKITTCYGDSGGPFFRESLKDKGKFEILGVTSFQLKNCLDKPTVFGAVQFTEKWMRDIIKDKGIRRDDLAPMNNVTLWLPTN